MKSTPANGGLYHRIFYSINVCLSPLCSLSNAGLNYCEHRHDRLQLFKFFILRFQSMIKQKDFERELRQSAIRKPALTSYQTWIYIQRCYHKAIFTPVISLISKLVQCHCLEKSTFKYLQGRIFSTEQIKYTMTSLWTDLIDLSLPLGNYFWIPNAMWIGTLILCHWHAQGYITLFFNCISNLGTHSYVLAYFHTIEYFAI